MAGWSRGGVFYQLRIVGKGKVKRVFGRTVFIRAQAPERTAGAPQDFERSRHVLGGGLVAPGHDHEGQACKRLQVVRIQGAGNVPVAWIP